MPHDPLPTPARPPSHPLPAVDPSLFANFDQQLPPAMTHANPAGEDNFDNFDSHLQPENDERDENPPEEDPPLPAEEDNDEAATRSSALQPSGVVNGKTRIVLTDAQKAAKKKRVDNAFTEIDALRSDLIDSIENIAKSHEV